VVVADVEAKHVEAEHVMVEAKHVMVEAEHVEAKLKNALHVKKIETTKRELVVIKNNKL
jgi:hypothetical protein